MEAVLEQTLVSVTLPEMGESVTEGSIVEWRKRVGDFVAEGDPLVEITTDKVDVEVPAPSSGVVTQILAREGETVAVGARLAEIDASKTEGAPSPKRAARPNGAPPPTAAAEPSPRRPGESVADAPARRTAQRLGVDLSRVRGSGPEGLILRGDVLEQAERARMLPASSGPPLPPIPPNATLTKLKGPAAALTGYMEQSLSIPTATSFRSCRSTCSTRAAKSCNGAIKAAGRTEKVSFTHVIALRARARGARDAVHHVFVPARRRRCARVVSSPAFISDSRSIRERKDGTRFR